MPNLIMIMLIVMVVLLIDDPYRIIHFFFGRTCKSSSAKKNAMVAGSGAEVQYRSMIPRLLNTLFSWLYRCIFSVTATLGFEN